MSAKLLLFIVLYITVGLFAVPFGIAITALLGVIYVNHRYLAWRKKQPGIETSIPGLPRKNT